MPSANHLLELPKFAPASDNLGELPPLERWLYFLLNAEKSESSELSRLLVDHEYSEAAEVLEMISRSPEDRQFYEARMKFLHDEEARLIAAREEGRVAGREEGAIAGKIQMLQQLLGKPEQTTSELGKMTGEEQATLLTTLQQLLRSRQG